MLSPEMHKWNYSVIVSAFLSSSQADMDFPVLTQDSVLLCHPSVLCSAPENPEMIAESSKKSTAQLKSSGTQTAARARSQNTWGKIKHHPEAENAAVHCSPTWASSCHIKVRTGMITVLKLSVKTTSVPPNHSSTPPF